MKIKKSIAKPLIAQVDWGIQRTLRVLQYSEFAPLTLQFAAEQPPNSALKG